MPLVRHARSTTNVTIRNSGRITYAMVARTFMGEVDHCFARLHNTFTEYS